MKYIQELLGVFVASIHSACTLWLQACEGGQQHILSRSQCEHLCACVVEDKETAKTKTRWDPRHCFCKSKFISSRVWMWLTCRQFLSEVCVKTCGDVRLLALHSSLCSSSWRRVRGRADGLSFLSAGRATAWRWEDASSSLSLLFHLLFSQSVAARLPLCICLHAAVQGRSFRRMDAAGALRAQTSADAKHFSDFRLDLSLDSLHDSWHCVV